MAEKTTPEQEKLFERLPKGVDMSYELALPWLNYRTAMGLSLSANQLSDQVGGSTKTTQAIINRYRQERRDFVHNSPMPALVLTNAIGLIERLFEDLKIAANADLLALHGTISETEKRHQVEMEAMQTKLVGHEGCLNELRVQYQQLQADKTLLDKYTEKLTALCRNQWTHRAWYNQRNTALKTSREQNEQHFKKQLEAAAAAENGLLVQIDTLRQSEKTLQTDLKQAGTEQVALKKVLGKTELSLAKLKGVTEERNNLRSELANAQEALAGAREQIAALQTELATNEQVEERLQPLLAQAGKDAKEKEMVSLRHQLESKEGEVQALQNNNALLSDKVASLQEQLKLVSKSIVERE